jgi:hypothetical protein
MRQTKVHQAAFCHPVVPIRERVPPTWPGLSVVLAVLQWNSASGPEFGVCASDGILERASVRRTELSRARLSFNAVHQRRATTSLL